MNTNIKPNINLIVSLTLVIAIAISISACYSTKGAIVILENLDGKGFTMDFREWSSRNKCELSLIKGDELQVEVLCDEGEIALAINGKNGSEPYTGNNLKSMVFTVAVSETDEYEIQISGKNATGKVKVRNVESTDK
ncbi:MAG TPA: hypothetical protein GXX20_10920 [Clostridiaceae bacterium]|nr:hypothetical protein [Clostridiaceae bacterium]